MQTPQDRAAAEGRRVSFSVQATGSTPLTYQWQLNGTNIPRATHSSLAFTATLSRAGVYSVLVRDGSDASRMASANLEVQKRPYIRSHPKRQVVGQHQTATFSVTLNESGPYSAINWWHHSPEEPSHPIPPSAAQGVNTFQLVIPDANDNGTFNGRYWITVTNHVAGTISRRASLIVVGPPELIRDPSDKSVRAGSSTYFSVLSKADAGRVRSYQWYRNGQPIDGATSRILRLSRVQSTDQGFYNCKVTGIGGSTTSFAARLTVY